MTSRKQVIANQQNALKSTGPRTKAGKANVAQNSLKHGLFSKRVLLANESEQEFELLKSEFYEQFQPQGLLEHLFCERAFAAAWRLSRITQLESMLINYAATQAFGNGMIEVLCGHRGDELSLLSRYEVSLERALFRSLAELRMLQAARQLYAETIGFVPQNLPEETIEENVL